MKGQIFQLQYYYMRTGTQVTRTTKFLGDAFLPAIQRAGALYAGFFSPMIGARSPFILALTNYPSLAAFETAQSKLAGDREFAAAWDVYNDIDDPAYLGTESVLLRGFDCIPALEPPPAAPGSAGRIFELRTYHSVNEKASLRKIGMFEEGEAAIFRRLGMLPVFFGQGLTGDTLPSLTYMLTFDDLAARERLWNTFAGDPEWKKLSSRPELSDAKIVANITNSILSPLPFSQIR